jgi:hypothetical protein
MCTIFGHRVVDGLHSIENTGGYKYKFLIDVICRRSKTVIVL